MAPITNVEKIHTLVHMGNASFDKKYQVNAFELLAYDPLNADTENALKRVTTNAMGEYFMNDSSTVENSISYRGLEDSTGDWIIEKLDETDGVARRFATKLNNTETTDYSDAWTNRADLTYNTYGTAF